MTAKTECTSCCGNGGIVVLKVFNEGDESEYRSWVEAWCDECMGTGRIAPNPKNQKSNVNGGKA